MKKIRNLNKKEIVTGVFAVVLFTVLCFVCVKCSKSKEAFFDGDLTAVTSQSPVDNGKEADEANEQMLVPGTELYDNNKQLSAKDRNGGELVIGVKNGTAAGIVINPNYTLAKKDYKIGYYIAAENLFRFNYSDTEGHNVDNSANVIIDWTYDKLKAAEYENYNNYGVKWSMEFDDKTVTDDGFKLVVVDMASHNILSTFNVEIVRNNSGKFELSDMYNSDISLVPEQKIKELWESDIVDFTADTGTKYEADNLDLLQKPFEELDLTATRQQLIDAALKEIESGKYVSVEEPFNLNNTVVELTKGTYHLKYITDYHSVGYIGRLERPVWAVTINSVIPDMGHYTLYFEKELLRCIGCDFIHLNSEEELNSFIKE
jgi:hypothetical protein